MSKLYKELQRLYLSDDASGCVRAILVGVAKSADWNALLHLYEAVQDELGLPAPAVLVGGDDGFVLWFSLASPLAAQRADAFAEALRARYLGEFKNAELLSFPAAATTTTEQLVARVAARCPTTGRWSAFIDPTLGCLFSEQAGLEMAPGRDRQAERLARYESIAEEDLARALVLLAQRSDSSTDAMADPSTASGPLATALLSARFDDPRSFLLALMNDTASPAPLRLEAAKALLPYFEKAC